MDLIAQLAGLERRERWAWWGRPAFTSESKIHIQAPERSSLVSKWKNHPCLHRDGEYDRYLYLHLFLKNRKYVPLDGKKDI